MSTCTTVLISVFSSIVASLIWITLTILFDFSSYKKIDILLETVLDDARLFQHSIAYCDYEIALQEANNIIKKILEINNCIKFFTFRFQGGKRKFIFTVLYNAIYNITIFKNISEGYTGKEEHQARCKKYQRNYLYLVKYSEEPFLAVSLEMLQSINNRKRLKRNLQNNLYINFYKNEQKKTIYENLIEPKTFNYKGSVQHYMKKSTFTQKQYNNLLNRFFPTK